MGDSGNVERGGSLSVTSVGSLLSLLASRFSLPTLDMRTLLIALLAFPVARPMCQTAAPPLWNGLTPGQFDVGFRRLEGGRTRVDVWYPSADTGRRMVYRDYVGAGTDGLVEFLRNTDIGSATVDSFVNSPLRAIENGQPSGVVVRVTLPLAAAAKPPA